MHNLAPNRMKNLQRVSIVALELERDVPLVQFVYFIYLIIFWINSQFMLVSRKIRGILFADNFVLVIDNPQDLQNALNALHDYCISASFI